MAIGGQGDLGSIPKRGWGGPGIIPGLDHLLWNTGRFVRDFTASALAPLVASTEWRRRRLLILGYHGVSLDDEHLWDSAIYMAADIFKRRLNILRQSNCAVLPLNVALRQLQEGTLPPRAVTLAFDDGFHDFTSMVAPVLAEFGYPATVFVSSYYAQFNRPIFDVMLSYLLWKAFSKTLALPGILDRPMQLDNAGQNEARHLIRTFAFERGLSGWGKDKLLAGIADTLDIDYEELCRKRILHMMNAEEVRKMRAAGHDIQLHTHRHRVSRRRSLFEREIRDNRRWIENALGQNPTVHLSFPGGVWQPVERDWMVDLGIESATTCHAALAEAGSDLLRLPRFMDGGHVPERVFRAWIAGSMAFFPQGKDTLTDGQIVEDTLKVRSDESSLVETF